MAIHPIEVSHVSKRYRIGSKHDSLRDAIPALLKRLSGRNGKEVRSDEFWALQDVSFHVKKGETLGIIGPNGAGKSTILKLLSKICKETNGNIHIGGRLAALIEVGAGFHQDLTGRENIYLNGTIMGLRRKEIERRFNSIVEFSELDQFLDMPVKRYSSGMVVRLGFAIAAHMQPEILLVDEVLAVGDIRFQQKCFERIRDLKEKGTTIIFISHNLDAVQRLCDRVLVLENGKVSGDGSTDEMIMWYRKQSMRYESREESRPRGAIGWTAGDIEVTGVRLSGLEGKTKDAFETGEQLNIEISYRVKRRIKQPTVIVTIERLDGLICHEASTETVGFDVKSWESAGQVTLAYEELNLLPNAYQVQVRIFESGNPALLVDVRNCVYFHVTSNQHARGTVHLKHKWIVRS